MGWEVRVVDYVAHRATCAESRPPDGWEEEAPPGGCGWLGTPDVSREEAEAEAAEHYQAHVDGYAAYNRRLESTDCTGGADCDADTHVHGCHADRDGACCDTPAAHRPAPPPRREPSPYDLVRPGSASCARGL